MAYDFKDFFDNLKKSVNNLLAQNTISNNPSYNKYNTNILSYKINNSLGKANDNISKVNKIIKAMKEKIKSKPDINLIIEFLYKYAEYLYTNINYAFILKNIIVDNSDGSNINDIKSKLDYYLLNKNNFFIYIKTILDQFIIDDNSNKIIYFASNIIERNYNIIILIYSYLLMYYSFNNITNIVSIVLLNNIDEIDKAVYNTEIIIEDNIKKIDVKNVNTNNKFMGLYNIKNEIELNIKKLYPNYKDFEEKKKEGYIPILIQSEVFPRDTKTLFLNKKDLEKEPKETLVKSNLKRKVGEIENKEIELQSSKITTLYKNLYQKAMIYGELKPVNIPINDKVLSDIFTTFFSNTNKMGTEVILNQRIGQGAATSGRFYNENIIIQNIIFITIVANYFKEIIEYKGKKIFEIINTIEKDNTYKIYSFIKTKNNYYSKDDYKIITLVYACLYNIIKIKHEALLDEKEKGRDKYDFLGYYKRKNKYNQIEKLFSLFDVIMEITKSN